MTADRAGNLLRAERGLPSDGAHEVTRPTNRIGGFQSSDIQTNLDEYCPLGHR